MHSSILHFHLTKLLSEKKLLSSAVICVDKKSKDYKKVIGIVDVFDILSTLISIMPEKKDLNDIDELERSYRAINGKNITSIMNKSGKNPFEPMLTFSPASTLIPMFAGGIHRVPVLDEKENLIVNVSQSLVVKYLHSMMQTKKDLKEFGKKTLKELFLGNVIVKSLNSSDTVIRAFKLMNKLGISAIPIVKDESIVGNFSNSDVKGFCSESIPAFTQKIEYFLEKQATKSLSPVTCKAEDTFESVLAKLATGVHRVWVVDEKNRPISVVSMSDIFKVARDFTQ
jgi:CBS-domain-containing membrane protein